MIHAARYAEAAKRKQLANIASAEPGQRNNQLNKSAYNLAAFLNEGVWTEAELEHELESAAMHAGLVSAPNCGLSGIRRTIASEIRAGRRNQIVLPSPKSRYSRH